VKKILIIVSCLLTMNVWADAPAMAQDILAQIVHGSVNTDPDLSEAQADGSVIVSLKAAAITLACQEQYAAEESSVVSGCIERNKKAVLTIGDLSQPAFSVGQQAALQQAKIHREVTLKKYPAVINLLVGYVKNLSSANSLLPAL